MLASFIERNVNDHLAQVVMTVEERGIEQQSRNGPVKSFPGLLTVETTSPKERVLFNSRRAPNPFLHLLDGLAILSDYNSVEALASVQNRFRDYSDDGKRFHGFYGERLYNQVTIGCEILRQNPDSRQVVLSIWNETLDLGAMSKDIPCNVMVLPRVIGGSLSLTVVNRSNDIYWGMLGANIVQFSFLLEAMALELGLAVGTLTQTSTNAHIYTEFGPGKGVTGEQLARAAHNPYGSGYTRVESMDGKLVDLRSDVNTLMTAMARGIPIDRLSFYTSFFNVVVSPIFTAYQQFKQGDSEAHHVIPMTSTIDWHLACRDWLVSHDF